MTRHRRLRLRRMGWGIGLTTFLLLAGILGLCIGEVWLSPSEVVSALTGGEAPLAEVMIGLRWPRVVGALVVGGCLGLSGGITQSLLRNPLASPDIVGVTAGASMAALLSLLALGSASTFAPGAGSFSVPVLAIVGGSLSGALVVLMAWRGGLEPRRVVLVGLGVNAGLTALTSWFLLRADLPELSGALIWLAGSLSAVDPKILEPALGATAVFVVLAALSARQLSLLRFGERTVRSLGVNVPLAQVFQAGLAVAAASVACAIAGPVAFVAFCAPPLAMGLFRTEGPPALAGALVGALMVVVADIVARTVLPTPVPVGLVTSFCGAPALLWILTRRRASA